MKEVWRLDKATVRDVYEALREKRTIAYTTVMTMMKILEDKGYLKKTQVDRAYVYRPARPRQQVVGAMVRDFVDRVFDGAAGGLLLHLARDGSAGADGGRTPAHQAAHAGRREGREERRRTDGSRTRSRTSPGGICRWRCWSSLPAVLLYLLAVSAPVHPPRLLADRAGRMPAAAPRAAVAFADCRRVVAAYRGSSCPRRRRVLRGRCPPAVGVAICRARCRGTCA